MTRSELARVTPQTRLTWKKVFFCLSEKTGGMCRTLEHPKKSAKRARPRNTAAEPEARLFSIQERALVTGDTYEHDTYDTYDYAFNGGYGPGRVTEVSLGGGCRCLVREICLIAPGIGGFVGRAFDDDRYVFQSSLLIIFTESRSGSLLFGQE